MSNEVLAPDKPLGGSNAKTADDINDLFKSLDTESPIKEPPTRKSPVREPDSEPEEKPKKDIEELEEGEDVELEEPEEEVEKPLDLTEEEPSAPPRKKEIIKKYPNVFKDFPFLEKMMYRDRQITEMFGSFDDAREVAEKYEMWGGLENQLLQGDTSGLLTELKNSDERAFNIAVDEYLPTLAKVDKDAYFHVVGNLNKRLIMEMFEEGNRIGSDDLKQAALLVNQYVFGSSKFVGPTLRVNKEAVKSDEAETERVSYLRERFETAVSDLQGQADNTLRATISEYIDPKGSMSSYVKKNAVNDAMDYLRTSLASNENVTRNLDKLWRQVVENKFSKESLGRVKSYYLSANKPNLKAAILKAREEALKDTSPSSRREEEIEEETPSRRRNIPTGKPSQPRGRNEMRKGESVQEFFARD
jgi:hypothetical protein